MLHSYERCQNDYNIVYYDVSELRHFERRSSDQTQLLAERFGLENVDVSYINYERINYHLGTLEKKCIQ